MHAKLVNRSKLVANSNERKTIPLKNILYPLELLIESGCLHLADLGVALAIPEDVSKVRLILKVLRAHAATSNQHSKMRDPRQKDW